MTINTCFTSNALTSCYCHVYFVVSLLNWWLLKYSHPFSTSWSPSLPCLYVALSHVFPPPLSMYCISPIKLVLYEKALIESGKEHTGDLLILAGRLHSVFNEPHCSIIVQWKRLEPSRFPVQRDFPLCLVILVCIWVCVKSRKCFRALLCWSMSKPLRSYHQNHSRLTLKSTDISFSVQSFLFIIVMCHWWQRHPPMTYFSIQCLGFVDRVFVNYILNSQTTDACICSSWKKSLDSLCWYFFIRKQFENVQGWTVDHCKDHMTHQVTKLLQAI